MNMIGAITPDHGIGHNQPPMTIETLLCGEAAPTDEEVLEALYQRWLSNHPEIAEIASKADMLAKNKDRLPGDLDNTTINNALNLYQAIESHQIQAASLADGLPAQIKSYGKIIDKKTKSLVADLTPLTALLRKLIQTWLVKDLNTRNSARGTDLKRLSSNVVEGASGIKASISIQTSYEVLDPQRLPREFQIIQPDLARIAKAFDEGDAVDGVTVVNAPQLRITQKK